MVYYKYYKIIKIYNNSMRDNILQMDNLYKLDNYKVPTVKY
jgi:hypothetical protein